MDQSGDTGDAFYEWRSSPLFSSFRERRVDEGLALGHQMRCYRVVKEGPTPSEAAVCIRRCPNTTAETEIREELVAGRPAETCPSAERVLGQACLAVSVSQADFHSLAAGSRTFNLPSDDGKNQTTTTANDHSFGRRRTWQSNSGLAGGRIALHETRRPLISVRVCPPAMAEMIQIIKNNCLAKALYDNHAESPEELEFQKGDMLTVLEQNPNGLQGWWLCALRGRQGIAPGNRLRLMPYMYDPTGLGFATGVVAHNIAVAGGTSHSNNMQQVGATVGAGNRSEYDVPAVATLPRTSPHGREGSQLQATPKLQTFAAPSTQSQNYDEPKPSSTKLGGGCGGQYDIPRGITQHFRGMSLSDGQYDFPQGVKVVNGTNSVPGASVHAEYDAPAARSAVAPLKAASLYDKPPNQQQHLDMSTFKEKCPAYDVPVGTSATSTRASLHSQGSSSGVTGSQSSLNTSLSSGGGSNRSSLEQQAEEAYDIPQLGPKRPVGGFDSTPVGLLKVVTSIGRAPGNSVYDTPPQ
ncbi:breast cancer anti-estrogen resistance protein 1-like, partial [Tropilaelaps mercedesae]